MGAGKASGGFGRCFVWEVEELVPFPAVSSTLLNKAKRNDNQIMVRTIWGEEQNQLNLRHLQLFGSTATRVFLLEDGSRAVMKDKNH